MKYLIDTCVISELIKKDPDKQVVSFINKQKEENIYLSVLTIGEIFKGISKLDDGDKKKSLNKWVNKDLLKRFENRIIDIDYNISAKWGEISGRLERKGSRPSVIDSLLASTCIVYEFVLVTRNIKDIKKLGCKYINPWG
jgi:toxin FitB